ncbi:hypothetical protein JTE90_008519 [Oedothorax gibbosus]|uniref:Mif2/CENP-C cupin domain-containing protein n=1 Tax=Oedothorax gibbosus TaxID=931172 RepID=A0AAV6VGP7_9ARAC|nr:hypothetical protein JTE90_008519 [Oedothorax gibbosus]
MERTRRPLRQGSGAKRNVHSNIPTPLRKTPVKRKAQPPSRGGSRAVPKIRQQSALKTGRGFQPPLNETDDEAAETEPVAANVRNVRRLTYVKPAPEVCQSPKKLQVAQKTSRKNIPQKVGRRTGTAAFEGKNIRLLPDGTENFDDYWTDSEAEISSRESVLKEKNSTFNKPSNVVPKELSMSPKKLAETVRYSTAPKIGRRTGVAAFEGKKIRLLPDGTENFDDYFTDDSSSKDSYLTEPSQKKSGIPLEESSAITDDEDSDRIMIHKSCDTRGLAVPTSSSKSKQLRERSAREETTEQHYKAKPTSLISPRKNLLASFMETDLKSSLNTNQPNKDFGRCNENETCSFIPADIEPISLRRSSLRKISQSKDRHSPSKQQNFSVEDSDNPQEDEDSDIPQEESSLRKMSQSEGKRFSPSKQHNFSVEDYDDHQEEEVPSSNASKTSRKSAARSTQSESRVQENTYRNHENIVDSVGTIGTEDAMYSDSPLRNQNPSQHRKSRSSLRKISQRKGTISSPLKQQNLPVEDSDSTQEDEVPLVNASKTSREIVSQSTPNANQVHENTFEKEVDTVDTRETEAASYRDSPLKNRNSSFRNKSKINAVPEKETVSNRKLEKSLNSVRKITQNKGTGFSASRHQNLTVEDSYSTQEDEASSSNVSLRRSPRKNPSASQNASRMHESFDNLGNEAHAFNTKDTESRISNGSPLKHHNQSLSTKNKSKVVEQPETVTYKKLKKSIASFGNVSQNKGTSFSSSRRNNLLVEESYSTQEDEASSSNVSLRRSPCKYPNASQNASRMHESFDNLGNEAHAFNTKDTESRISNGSPLKHRNQSLSTKNKSKVVEQPETVTYKKLEKSIGSFGNVSQNKGTSFSSSRRNNLLVEDSYSKQEDEAPSSNVSLRRYPLKNPSTSRSTQDASRVHENEVEYIEQVVDTNSVSFRGSPLKNKGQSVTSRIQGNVAVDHESHVSYKGLEKSFASRLKVSQNKGTSLSSSNHQDASADEPDSTQEDEALFSNKSFQSPRKKPRASRSNKSTSRIHEAKENLISYNDDQHMSSSKETEMPSRNSHQKNAGFSNTTKSKNKIIVQSINKTRSFKEPENSLSGVLKSKRLTKTFSHSKNTSFASFRKRNVWIEDSMSEDDSNITQSESIISKRKVLDYAEHSASDEADASHSVQPTTKVKKLKKGHDDISGNRLQQSLGQYEAENSVDKVASVEAVQKAPKVKKMHDLLKKRRSRKSVYVGNYGEDSSLDEADGMVSVPKIRKSNDDVSNKRLTRDNRGSIPSQEFVEENYANALPSNNDDTNASQIQNNKSKRNKHTKVSSEHSINDSAKNNAENLSGEDETGNESQARKVRKSKKNKHDDVTSEGPRRNITTAAESIARNLSDEAETHLVHKGKKAKINKSNNVSNKGPSTRNITETGALVSADDETPSLLSAEDAVEAIQVPKATKLNKKDGKSPNKHRPSISRVDEIDNEADATKVEKSNQKKQKNKLPSTEGVRRGTRTRIPPLETWRGQRQVFKYKSGEGFVFANISPGRKEDDGCRQAILKRMQRKEEMKMKEKKKGASRHIPKTTVFDAFREKEVNVHLHRPFDFVEWTAITVAEGSKVPYYLTKTFASDNVTFGFLEICPLEMKASQYSPEDNIHFLVAKGSLKVVIHKSEFTFERLDTFIVPCKEVYSIENIGKTKALLSFCTFKTPFFPYQIIATNQQE